MTTTETTYLMHQIFVDLTLLKASTSILYKNRMDVKPLSKPVFVDAPSPELKEEDDSIEVSSYFHDEDRYEDFSNYDDESSSDSISVKLLINKTPTSKMSVNYSDVEQDSKESPVIRTEIPSLEKKTFHILSELRKSCPAKNVVSASGYLPCEAVEVNCDIFGSSDTNVEDVGQLTPIKPSNKREGTFDEKEQRGIGLRNFRFDKNALKEQENSDTCESSDMIVEDVRQLTPINSCNDGERTIDETESREVKLRNFRFDKEKAVKEQVKLLRHIHIEEEECFREKEFTSLHANNSTPGVKTGGLSGDARTHTPGKLRKLVNNLNIRANFNKPYKIFVVKSSGMAQSSLSKPVFVDAPSPNSKNKDDEYNNEKSTIYVDESSSDNPLGGMSMKLLMSKTPPSKVSVNCSDVEQDSQESPVIQSKVVKRMRFLASSDEDEDLTSAKKQQLNDHDSASEDSFNVLEEGIIEKFVDMWEKVYTFVDKMDILDIYRKNVWDAELTMEDLDTINMKNKYKREKMVKKMSKKRKLAKQRVEEKKQKVPEEELASVIGTATKEKFKTQEQAWKVGKGHPYHFCPSCNNVVAIRRNVCKCGYSFVDARHKAKEEQTKIPEKKVYAVKNGLYQLCPSCNVAVHILRYVCNCGYSLIDARCKAKEERRAQTEVKLSHEINVSGLPVVKNGLYKYRLCPSCNVAVHILRYVCNCGYSLIDARRKAKKERRAQTEVKISEEKNVSGLPVLKSRVQTFCPSCNDVIHIRRNNCNCGYSFIDARRKAEEESEAQTEVERPENVNPSGLPVLKSSVQKFCPSCNDVIHIRRNNCNCGYSFIDARRKAEEESEAQTEVERPENVNLSGLPVLKSRVQTFCPSCNDVIHIRRNNCNCGYSFIDARRKAEEESEAQTEVERPENVNLSGLPVLKSSLQQMCPSCHVVVHIRRHVCNCGYSFIDARRIAKKERKARVKRQDKKVLLVCQS
ncbi:uncharacterized protein [Procambarus clarkii]|uniref:uncharacterized protein isoform X2 n=1 Tax=Procambarus clarkii TaxID=6728 RepID=UPI003741ED88